MSAQGAIFIHRIEALGPSKGSGWVNEGRGRGRPQAAHGERAPTQSLSDTVFVQVDVPAAQT
jgi:hypothetical protein